MSIPETVQVYLRGPSCPAPEGETSNLDNPPNSNGEAFFFAILCAIIVTSTTLARAYSRICLVKQVHVEDCMTPLQTLCVHCYTHTLIPRCSRPWHWCNSMFLKFGPFSFRLLTLSRYPLLGTFSPISTLDSMWDFSCNSGICLARSSLIMATCVYSIPVSPLPQHFGRLFVFANILRGAFLDCTYDNNLLHPLDASSENSDSATVDPDLRPSRHT